MTQKTALASGAGGFIPGPVGLRLRGRNSVNRLIAGKPGRVPEQPLKTGIARTFGWIPGQPARPRNQPG